jgi:hypothetical protein
LIGISPLKLTNKKLNFFNSISDFSIIPKRELISSESLNNLLDNSMNPINIFNTQAEVFHDNSYFDKEYSHMKIHRKDDYYYNMIRSKIEYFKTNDNQNSTTVLHRTYNKSIYPVELVLSSLEIRFINTTDIKASSISFYLPFALLPINYFVDIEIFKLVLMAILRFKSDLFNEIAVQDDQISSILSTWGEYEVDSSSLGNNSSNVNVNKFNCLTSKCIYDVYIK